MKAGDRELLDRVLSGAPTTVEEFTEALVVVFAGIVKAHRKINAGGPDLLPATLRPMLAAQRDLMGLVHVADRKGLFDGAAAKVPQA